MTEIRVLDASALIAYITGTLTVRQRLYDILHSKVLVAPKNLPVEATSALRALERSGDLSSNEVTLARSNAMKFQAELYPFNPLADRIWELRHNLTVYDAWYVALAEALNAPLVTTDIRLAHSPGARCEFIVP